MNVMKNMEAIFLAAVALAGITTYASAAIPAIHGAQSVQAARVSVEQKAIDGQPMQVITVTAKRLSAADKERI
ncbi:hypothetical protein [Massilia sp. 9096]|uniref:hypothetical protein n=1 Tax=Massilia sp. 9096 TaxID=1500894 RepID=UPI00055F7DD8|nr:hypothetical protein [Massilia sp. 9096]